MSNSNTSQLGTILGIWAHPDDETFTIGGLLAMAADAGQQTICVTATRGEKGGKGDNLAEIRTQELVSALNILGVSEQQYLGYQDGACAEVNEAEAVAKLVVLINQYQPDTIVTFAPDGLTGHPDHQAVSRWAQLAAAQQNLPIYFAVHTKEAYDAHLKSLDELFNIYFATNKPSFVSESACDVLVHLEPAYINCKIQALEVMPSQYGTWFEQLSRQELAHALGTEALVAAPRWAGL